MQKLLTLAAAGVAAVALWGCSSGSSSAKVAVTLVPTTVTVLVNNTQQFAALVTNAKDTTVTWTLNGNAASDTMSPIGKISTSGLYTAPPTLPNPLPSGGIVVKATANQDKTTNATATITLDSGVVVTIAPGSATIGTTQQFTFTANVQNDPQNLGVAWTVQGGTNGSNGTINSTGLYTAPATVPNPAAVTIQAASNLDSNKKATATVTTVTTSGPPALTSINPTSGAQGSLFQDIYLNGSDLLSTTVVKFNNQQIPASNVLLINQSLLRVRVPDTFLAVPGGPITAPITVQLGSAPPTSPPVNFKIVPVRPAVVESIPDSAVQNSVATAVQINGGFYGTKVGPGSPVVTAEFNGGARTLNSVNARQLSVQLNGTDQNTPGLYSVAVRNSNASPPFPPVAVTNFAVQPDPTLNGPSLKAKLPMPGTNPAPGAVAIDTVLGLAAVANTGTGQVQLIDLTLPTPALLGAPIPVGNSPTGIAVDNQRHIALVVNSANKTISIVDLVAKTATTPLQLSGFTSATPFSVGVNPNTGLALVAYSNTNSGSLIALAGTTSTLPCLPGSNATPPCVVGSVTLNSGPNPQIAVEPRFNLAITTPGGAGVLSIVDLNRQNSIPIASASRVASGVVTITTASPHKIDPTNPGSVLINGVTDASFNGTFTVTSVPSATTFTYSQSITTASSSGSGTVQLANPLVTFSVSPTVQGISFNTQTERALLADGSASLSVLSTLDQTNASVLLGEGGAKFTAFNPFTNVGVSVNPSTNALSLIDPVKLQRLTSIATGGGTGSGPVAIDPGTNLAVVTNTMSNDVSVISLGTIKPVHVDQVLIPSGRQLSPGSTLITTGVLTPDLPITILGKGFAGSPQVRLDGDATAVTVNTVVDRVIHATIHAAALSKPRRFALDVINGTNQSNAADFTVVQAVPIAGGSGCTTPKPAAVAIAQGIDAGHPDLAVVANSGCNSVSLIDITPTPGNLNFGTETNAITVGTAPEGVATISRLGHAVVTNSGSNNASVVDLVGGTVTSTVTTGTLPLGVAINQDTGFAVVANAGSNTISVFDANAGGTAGSAATDQRPIAVAVDPSRNIALVANALNGTLQVFTLSTSNSATFSKSIAIGSSTIPPLPTSLVFDTLSGLFFAASGLSDAVLMVNTDAGTAQSIRVGINPTSLAYNYLTSTLVSINSDSNTLSTADAQAPQTLRTTAIQGLGNTSQCPVDPSTGVTLCAVDLHPLTNLAVITDPANNRVLLVPLSK